VVYAITQLLSKFVIDPIYKLDEIREQIADSLVFYANIYSNPRSSSHKEKLEASRALRGKSTLLRARARLIRWYGFLSWINAVPKKKDVEEASALLIGVSNMIFDTTEPPSTLALKIEDTAKRIREFLNLEKTTEKHA